jgi:hypothetical protein
LWTGSKDPAFRPQIDAYEEMMSPHGTDYTGVVRSGYRTHDKMEMLFDGECHHDELPGLRQLDWNTFRGHTMSLSVAPPARPPRLRDSRARSAPVLRHTLARRHLHHAHPLLDHRRPLPSVATSRPEQASGRFV